MSAGPDETVVARIDGLLEGQTPDWAHRLSSALLVVFVVGALWLALGWPPKATQRPMPAGMGEVQ